MDYSAGPATPQPNLSRSAERPAEGLPLSVLHEAVQAIARQTDARDTLHILAEKARGLTSAASVAVTLLDDTRTLLDFAAVAGPDADQIVGQTVRAEDALAGQTALTGELYLAHHAGAARPLLAALEPDLSQGWGVHSAVVVPIYRQGRPQGAVTAINRDGEGAFTPGDIVSLQLFANMCALALGMDDLKRQVAQKQRERDILFQAVRTTSSSLNVQEVLQNVLATVGGTLDMTAGAVFLLNDERTRLYIGADEGLDGEDRERQLPTDGPGVAAQALLSSQPLLIADASGREDTEDLPLPHMRSLLLAPMVARSSAEGLIVAGSRQPGAFTQDDARLLSAVASQAAVALENAWLYEDATRRAQEATALYELSQAVGATLHLDRVLHFVADSVLALLHVDKFALFLLNPGRQILEIKIARNISRECVQTMKPRLGEGIAGWVAEFETPTAVQDVAADHRNRSCPIDGEGIRSLVSVPLQSGDKVIGVLHAMSSRRRLFTVGEMELLYTIANQVGAATANAQMYEEARQQSDEIRKGVRRISRALGASRSAQETAQSIADLATETTESDRSVLYTLDGKGELSVRATANIKGQTRSAGEDAKAGETPAQWVARRGRSLAIENIAQDTRFSLPPFAARDRVAGYLGVPLKFGADILGVLEVYSREPRRFSPDEVRLFLVFASQAGVALQNALLVEQAGRRLADLKAIRAISTLLHTADGDEALCRQALALIGEATQADAGAIFGAPSPSSRCDWQRNGSPGIAPPLLETLLEQSGGGTVHRGPGEGYEAALIVPLEGKDTGALRGIVLVHTSADTLFDENDRYLVLTAANLLPSRPA